MSESSADLDAHLASASFLQVMCCQELSCSLVLWQYAYGILQWVCFAAEQGDEATVMPAPGSKAGGL